MRVHADLFGPLKSIRNNKHILCLTHTFTKIAVVVPIPDKEATTAVTSILHHWIYRFSAPQQIQTDGGKEFINNLSDELWKLWDIKHTKTTAAHPQCNAQVENFNKCIKEYLAPFIHDNSLDWEFFYQAMNFAYNTSYHSTIGTTPFQLFYAYPADTPGFQNKVLQENPTFETHASRLAILAKERRKATLHSETQKDQQKKVFDEQAQVHGFLNNQLVLVCVSDFLNKNPKLATKFDGPFTIVEVDQHDAVLRTDKGKLIKGNILHLKPLHPQMTPTPAPAWARHDKEGEERDEAEADNHINLAYAINLLFSKKKTQVK